MKKGKLLAVLLSTALVLVGMTLPNMSTEDILTAEAASDIEYHAYLCFKTDDSFRYAWDDEDYGLYGIENTDEVTYDMVHTKELVWDIVDGMTSISWELVSSPGTFENATIIGDGTYTVSVSGLEWDDDEFSDTGAYWLLGVSTDIPWYVADITVDKVVIGDTVFTNPEIFNEGTAGYGYSDYIMADVENTWYYDLSLGEYDAMSSDVSITFTISGLSSEDSEEQDTSTVTEADELTPEVTSNANDQNYGTYGEIVNSYLVSEEDGFMRVEYNGECVVVEYYDSNFSLTSKLYVEVELPIFGGFYAGEDAYYLVFGQENPDQDDSVEVIRVVKYSTDWERLGNASLHGANTYIPFKSGSCRMAEYNGFLYIRTCHTMYGSAHHQSNFTVIVDETYMEVANYKEGICSDIGYVSHSFNQFILIDDEGYIIAVDHGDGYPRAVTLLKTDTKAGILKSAISYDSVDVLSIEGEIGENKTGVSIGGMEYSSNSYLVVGNSVEQDEDYSSHSVRNIFVGVVSRDDVSDSGATLKWITNYDTDGNTTASTPQLVKVGDDLFLLLWEISGFTKGTISKLNYVFLDGEGNAVSEIFEEYGNLSDCQPIFTGSEVVWYVTYDVDSTYSSYEPYFCSIDLDGNFSILNTVEGDINLDGTVDYLDAMIALRFDAELTTLFQEQKALADVNNDGSVDSLDAILILRYDAGLIEAF